MRFSWERFPVDFLKEIIRSAPDEDLALFLDSDDKDDIIACVNSLYKAPDRRFVLKYRTLIETGLFPRYPNEVRALCRSLKLSRRGFNDCLLALSRQAFSENAANAYLTALYSISGLPVPEYAYSNFRYTRAVNMAQTEASDVALYQYQQTAAAKLKQFFVEEDGKAGMLVMPTGSGKTRTAVCFLIREMISRGYQVLWLAHRHMLLDQSAENFLNFAGLSKLEKPTIRDYRISCISGEHLHLSQIGKHEIIIASVASVCRNHEQLRRVLGRKVMVVVDECHHAHAKSYRDTIRFIRGCRKDTKLLGLTATPIRANDNDSSALLALFGSRIIYSIPMSALIRDRILADPHFIRKETGTAFEADLTPQETKWLCRYEELPESLALRIATSAQRNRVIVDDYLEHRQQYGKTLIFALNVLHCRLLYEELKKHGVRCGCVYSGQEDNERIIREFRSGKIQVLINVNIMTEGTDVPDIRTVMLTRPTQSEGFLVQMIGRGMRGPRASGGTQTVNIVDFHDQWEVFSRWLNPKWIFSDEAETVQEQTQSKKLPYESYDWKKCLELYRSIATENRKLGMSVMIPVGWYPLIDVDGNDAPMLVYENQLSGFRAMKEDRKSWQTDPKIRAEQIAARYFKNFADCPPTEELQLLLEQYRTNDGVPTLCHFRNREAVDPVCIVRKAKASGADAEKAAEAAYEQYPETRALFGTKEAFLSEIRAAQVGNRPCTGQRVEELPIELIPYDQTPRYDLYEQLQKVKDRMFGGHFEGITDIRWTDAPYKTFYGRFYPHSGVIEINSVLNSKDVPQEVIQYLIYHEMLHRDLPYHDAQFRQREGEFPQAAEWDHFLDGTMQQFDITQW